jgi:hypothetical protein
VGGLVGHNDGDVTHCYSTGAVSGNQLVGGLAGYNSGSITTTYSIGEVTGNQLVGGLVGYNEDTVTDGFWDAQTSGQATSAGGTGKTTAGMQDPSTFMAAGWDFIGKADGPHDTWAEPAEGGYPVLSWQLPPGYGLPTFSGGTGEPGDPYIISTAEDLESIGSNTRLMKCHFRVVDDVDLMDFPFYPIGDYDNPYKGVFDGNNHTISDLTITGDDYVGLFGQLASGAEVKNLGVVDVSITGTGSYVGGLVGMNNGTVTKCYSTGAVDGNDYVGGLAGSNSGTVTQCYGTGTVSGNEFIGGLVGDNYNRGDVTHCYSTGAVSGSGQWSSFVAGLVGFNAGSIATSYSAGTVSGTCAIVGGLVGFNFNSGSITTSYSTGAASGPSYVGGLVGDNSSRSVTGCFWDIQTSGLTSSAAGTGKTTAEMKTKSTFTNARWAFVCESENGTEDIWAICEGKDYPRLAWQFVIGDYNGDGDTDFADFCILAEHWLATANSFWCSGGGIDLTNDGLVDLQDLMIFGENWLGPTGP